MSGPTGNAALIGARAGGHQVQSEVELDALDRVLLRILQADGRASYAAMAAAVGLTPPSVRARVQRLLAAGVVQIVGVTDPMRLGWPVMALVGVSVRGDLRDAADTLGQINEVCYVVLASGEHDLLVELVCATPEHLLVVVNDCIRGLPNVLHATVWPYLDIHTHRFTWGAPEPPVVSESVLT